MKTMPESRQKALETAAFLRSRILKSPEIGILTGTGLSRSIESVKIDATFAYDQIPHFPVSTVQSHTGRLLFGNLGGKPIAAMQGRFHLYEGYSPLEVTFPIRVMQELGVKVLILSNAAGGFHSDFRAGDIMIITDHINLTGRNLLIGPNEDRWGLRFPDMSRVYDKALSEIVQGAGIPLKKGVYAGLSGPSLETPAEVRFLKIIGADAVGFSTVMEAIAGVHAGMRILGLSTITNVNDPENPVPGILEEIIAVADEASVQLNLLFTHVAEHLT